MAGIASLFFLSGFAGLIYEVSWMRMLDRAFGSTTYATSNILAIFMAGLAAGGWIAGRYAARLKSPLRAYGLVELALAAAALFSSWAVVQLPELFARLCPAASADSFSVILVRSALALAVLFPPTFLMGATLPVLCEYDSRRRSSAAPGRWSGAALLYGLNTLGAVCGVLISGFYALGAFGESLTVASAVAVNAAVGGIVILASFELTPEPARPAPPEAKAGGGAATASRIAGIMALSGFCALAFEVIWTRMLILLLGTSVYGFSAMLIAYLAGIGGGSLIFSRRLFSAKNPERVFAFLLSAAGLLAGVTAEFYLALGLHRSNPVYLYTAIGSKADFLALLALSFIVVLPVTLIYGALFPLAVKIVDPSGSGRAVGRVYAANTLGCVLGPWIAGFILIPRLGTHGSLALLCVAQLLLGSLGMWKRGRRFAVWPLIAAVVLLISAAARPDPFLQILSRRLERFMPGGAVAFHHEGPSATVTGFKSAEGRTLLLINGIRVSATGDLGRVMIHLPLLLRPAPKRVLVICLGAGNTLRAAVDHGMEVDVVEIEPEVLAAFPRIWPDWKDYLMKNGVRTHVNDGRNFILTSRETYDVIIVDGSPPIYAAGTVNLYTREFVELAKARLGENGILAMWVPLPCFLDDFWMIARNFTDAFPHTAAWLHPDIPGGALLMGSPAALDLDPKKLEARARERRLLERAPWLNGGLLSPVHVISDEKLRERAAHYPPVTDDMPRTEFPLPRFWRGQPLVVKPELLF